MEETAFILSMSMTMLLIFWGIKTVINIIKTRSKDYGKSSEDGSNL